MATNPFPSHCHPGPVFNKSFPQCMHPSLADSLRSTALSGSTHLGQKTSGGSGLRIFAGAKIYYRSDLLLLAETLVTVSPCEFPPRCHPRILPCHPRASFFVILAVILERSDRITRIHLHHPIVIPVPPTCHPRLGRGSPLFPRISHFLHLIFPKILYRLHTNNLLKRRWL